MSKKAFHIKLRAPGQPERAIPFGKEEAALAREWTNMVSNRGRWQHGESILKDIYRQASENWHFSAEEFRAMAGTGLLEVAVPWLDTPDGHAARNAPWEFVITCALRAEDEKVPIPTIVRHLDTGLRSRPSTSTEPYWFVQSAPPALAGNTSFTSEQQLVQASLSEAVVVPLLNPTLDDLKLKMSERVPSIIHVAGFDTVQGAARLKVLKLPPSGIYLTGPSREPEPVETSVIASVLGAYKQNHPFLVSYNMYHSSEIAAATVAHGAFAALGFQDEFDDTLAEIFFTNYYLGLQSSNHNLLDAFRLAFRALVEHPRSGKAMQGTGIVLWTANSLAGGATVDIATAGISSEAATKVRELKEKIIAGDARSIVSVDVKPLDALNYCLLHNGGSMFDTFVLRKTETGTLPNVSVDVQVQIEGDKFCYEESRDLIECSEPIQPCISLTSGMVRDLRERIQTSIAVQVRCEGKELYRKTYRVGLLATDEWENTDLNRRWLPSFVLPRDPAVDRVIRAAQSFLIALRDDVGAGFDGYQRGEPGAVDHQVQAIWWALVHQLAINYISPPPTFTALSQRLRSPSAVLDGSSGTCIDLALLLAACLEYVQIRPVIFLQLGHAYTGYLRSEADYEAFRALFQSKSDDSQAKAETQLSTKLQTPWMLEIDRYAAIAKLIEDDRLRPLDTVRLTHRSGFQIAREEGNSRFLDEGVFQAVYDIREARVRGVTPLPL